MPNLKPEEMTEKTVYAKARWQEQACTRGYERTDVPGVQRARGNELREK